MEVFYFIGAAVLIFLGVWAWKIRIYLKWERKKKANVAPFYRWPDHIHQEPAQRARLRQAREENFLIKYQDEEKGLAQIKSDIETEFVWCNLGMCQCQEYKATHKPCKHIYKIALEKGLIQ